MSINIETLVFNTGSWLSKLLNLNKYVVQVGLPMHCMCPTLSFSFSSSSSLSFSFFLFMSHLSFFLFMSHSLFLSLYVSFSLSFSLCLILSLSLSLPYGGKKFNLINAPPQLMLKKVLFKLI